MRNGSLLFSAVQFLIITVFFGGGVVFLGLHYLPQVRQELADWLIQPNGSFLFLGSLILGIALLLSICFWAMQKAHYIRIEMKKDFFSIDEAVVEKVISKFWKMEFPENKAPIEVYFANQKIEVIAEEVEQDLVEIQERLGAFLSKQLGYEREFFLTLITK